MGVIRVNDELVGKVDRRIDIDLSKIDSYDSDGIIILSTHIKYYYIELLDSCKELHIRNNGKYISINGEGKDAKIIIHGESGRIQVDDGTILNKLAVEKCSEIVINGGAKKCIIDTLIVEEAKTVKVNSTGIKELWVSNKYNELVDLIMRGSLCGEINIKSENDVYVYIHRVLINNFNITARNNVKVELRDLSPHLVSTAINTSIKAENVHLNFLDEPDFKAEFIYCIKNSTDISLDKLILKSEIEVNTSLDKIAKIESNKLYINRTGWIEILKTDAEIITKSVEQVNNKEIKLLNNVFSCMLMGYEYNTINFNNKRIVMSDGDNIEVDTVINPSIAVSKGDVGYKIYIKNDIDYTNSIISLHKNIPGGTGKIYVNYLSEAHKKLALHSIDVEIINYDEKHPISKYDNKLAMLGIFEESEIIDLIHKSTTGEAERVFVEINNKTYIADAVQAELINIVRTVGIKIEKDSIIHKHIGESMYRILENSKSDIIIKEIVNIHEELSLIMCETPTDEQEVWFIGNLYIKAGNPPANKEIRLKVLEKIEALGEVENGAPIILKNSIRYKNYFELKSEAFWFYSSLCRITLDYKDYIIVVGDKYIYKDNKNKLCFDKDIINKKINIIKKKIEKELAEYMEERY